MKNLNFDAKYWSEIQLLFLKKHQKISNKILLLEI